MLWGILSLIPPLPQQEHSSCEGLEALFKGMLEKMDSGVMTGGEGESEVLGGVTNHYTITINNPSSEPSSDSIRSTLLKHSYGLV